MKKMNVYLMFNGTCEQALDLYKEAIGGTILSMQRYGDAQPDIAPSNKNLVMHAEFQADNVYLMASDTTPESPMNIGNNVSLALDHSNEAEQTAVFEKLSAGGTITMPLQDTFWGARFGILTDRFGVTWMSNYDKEA